MDRMEMVEKIRERANVSVEEARDVLERNNWDILDAMVELERSGKISGGVETSTENKAPEYEAVSPTVSGKDEEKAHRKQKQQEWKEKLKKSVRVVIDNKFVVKNKDDAQILSLPVIIPIVCLLAEVWITAIALIAGLVCGLKYTLEGKELGKQSVNDGITKVSEAAKNIVNDITGRDGDKQGEETINR